MTGLAVDITGEGSEFAKAAIRDGSLFSEARLVAIYQKGQPTFLAKSVPGW